MGRLRLSHSTKKENILKSEKKNRSVATVIFVLVAAVVLLAIDQILKYFVLQDLKPIGAVTVIPGLLEFAYVENTGQPLAFLKISCGLW